MSTLYQIDYDLRAPGRNYTSLIDAIKSLGAWAHPLESTWLVVTTKATSEIANYLLAHMDRNDRLLVTRPHSDAAWYNLAPEVSTWLEEKRRLAA